MGRIVRARAAVSYRQLAIKGFLLLAGNVAVVAPLAARWMLCWLSDTLLLVVTPVSGMQKLRKSLAGLPL